MKKAKISLLCVTLIFIPNFLLAAVDTDNSSLDPLSLKMKVYKLAVSEHENCSNPVVVFENNTPQYLNMLSTPVLGNGKLKAGTYACLMVEISDQVTFSASTSGGSCSASTEVTTDLCSEPNTTYALIENQTANPCASGEQRIGLFFSTSALNQSGTAGFLPPSTSGNKGYTLQSKFTISTNTKATFVVNAKKKVDGSGSDCKLNMPMMSIR